MDLPIHVAFPLQGRLYFGKQLDPGTRLAPALKATVDGGPLPIALWHISPGCPGAQDPQDAVQDLPMILRRSPSQFFRYWEQTFQSLPLLVGQVASVSHGNQFTRLC